MSDLVFVCNKKYETKDWLGKPTVGTFFKCALTMDEILKDEIAKEANVKKSDIRIAIGSNGWIEMLESY